MRRIMLILLILLTWLPSLACRDKGTSIIGLETGSFIRSNELEILAGHSINRRWALKGGCRLNMSSFIKESAYSEHLDNLGYRQGNRPEESDNILTTYMAAEFWVNEIYKGPFISIGISLSRKDRIGTPVSLGYSCPIWKGLGCRMSYTSDIIGTLRHKHESSEIMSLGLTYSF